MRQESERETRRRTAVIGAGVAGTTAARVLHDAGRRVVLFDKARGAGGRTSTRRAPPHMFDHGAQYMTARDAELVAAVEAWVAEGVVAEWKGRVAVLREGAVRDAEPERRFVGVPGMSAICKHLASGADVRFGVRVGAVAHEAGTLRLVDIDGADLGAFDEVVVTTPPAQAVPLLAAAPDLAARVASVRMLPCWSVMAAFARPLDVPFDAAFVHGSPLGWIARDGGKPGRPTADAWVLQAGPEWSSSHVEDAQDVVLPALLAALGDALGRDLPDVVHADTHRWLYARTQEPLGAPCLVDAERRIAVAGDWCLGARVEAAYRSGCAAAAALLRGRA